jgi:hypothetical protein
MRSFVMLCVCAVVCGCGQKTVTPVSFRDQIQPVLSTQCVRCHNGELARGKIMLTSYEDVMGSRTYPGKKPLVVAREAAKSWLYIVCATTQPHYRMPPDTFTVVALSKEQLLLLSKWIDEGALNN